MQRGPHRHEEIGQQVHVPDWNQRPLPRAKEAAAAGNRDNASRPRNIPPADLPTESFSLALYRGRQKSAAARPCGGVHRTGPQKPADPRDVRAKIGPDSGTAQCGQWRGGQGLRLKSKRKTEEVRAGTETGICEECGDDGADAELLLRDAAVPMHDALGRIRAGASEAAGNGLSGANVHYHDASSATGFTFGSDS